jgi:sugar lactone lactonase YvrE
MSRSKITILIALGLLLGGSAHAGIDTVYVSNPDEGAIYQIDISGPITSTTVVTSTLLLQPGTMYEDLVVGPDRMLYACDPTNGQIITIDPGTGVATSVHDGTTTPPHNPQCGWFTADGELVVTDTSPGSGVWVFGAGGPTNLLDSADFGSYGPTFAGEGLTQAGRGDLLVVDAGNGIVWELAMDQYSGEFLPTTAPAPLTADTFDEPAGIARASGGDIFVAAAGDGVLRYDWDGSFIGTCGDFARKDEAVFLDFAADDTLYVATDSKKAGKLWRVDVDSCEATMLVEYVKPDNQPTLIGVAVPFTETAGKFIDDYAPTQFFTFNDHAFEFEAQNDCVVDVSAEEVDPDEIQALIESIPDPPIAWPVTYFGDNGRAQLYHVQPAEGADCPDGDQLLEPFLYTQAINAYAGYVPNPRIGVCHGANGDEGCELLDLTSYFPFNGFFPDDGRIATGNPSFSDYFLVNVELIEGTGDGCFCGFESPLVYPTEPDDPNLPIISAGSTLPVKFRVALGLCPEDGGFADCQNGPYLDQAEVLLSIARIDPFFDPIDVECVGTPDCEPLPIFENPNNPNLPYHLNLRTDGYEPGIYQAVLVAMTDNFPAVWTYFVVP